MHLHEAVHAHALQRRAALFGRRRQHRHLHACHGSPGYNFGWPISKMMLRRRRRKLDGKIAVSKVAMDYARKHVPGEYSIIPNGIDLGHFNPEVPPIKRFRDDKLNILFVGGWRSARASTTCSRLTSRSKRTPRLPFDCRRARCPLRRKYEKYVRNHNITDVVFAGMVSYDELPRYYQTADIFCSPGDRQGELRHRPAGSHGAGQAGGSYQHRRLRQCNDQSARKAAGAAQGRLRAGAGIDRRF